MKEIPEIYPLRTIWVDRLQSVCSLTQLNEWKGRVPHFPKPKKIMGKYKLYDADEVEEWVTLWRRATVNLGRGDELNAERSTGS